MTELIIIICLYLIYKRYHKPKPKPKPIHRRPSHKTTRRPTNPKLDIPHALHLTETEEQIAFIQDRLWDLDPNNPVEFETIKQELIEDLQELAA